MYKIIFSEKAIDSLEKLEIKNRLRILNKILSTKEQPFRYFQKLAYREGYKLRVGNYRVIVDIEERSKIITIHFIGHRKSIYEKIK